MSEAHHSILIVDDIPLNITLLGAMLRKAGYLTITAASGREGRRLALEQQPSLILLDITMPEEDGVTTCRILKADPRTTDIPVIFLSALSGTDIKVTGFATGAVDYITKPFEREEVLARISLHLQMRERYVAVVRSQDTMYVKLNTAQRGMLPKPDEMPDAAFAVHYRAFHAAGGDFYDVVRGKDGCYRYFIADISGHDVDTSLNTSAIKALFHQSSTAYNSPTEIVESIHRGLMPLFSTSGMHMTGALIQLDRQTRTATLVNAGHLPAIHLSVDGHVSQIETEGDILGVFDELVLVPKTFEVQKGDRIFIYTDGLIEQNNLNCNRHAGIKKLMALCHTTSALPLQEAVNAISSRIFPIDTPPTDDRLLVGIEV